MSPMYWGYLTWQKSQVGCNHESELFFQICESSEIQCLWTILHLGPSSNPFNTLEKLNIMFPVLIYVIFINLYLKWIFF
jgi:hypothetical protein